MKTLVIPAITPDVEVPEDEGLPGLSNLFESEWVWNSYCANWGEPDDPPGSIRLEQFLYHPRHSALAAYAAEHRWGKFVMQDKFAIEIRAGKTPQIFRYPFDPYLPGLEQAASPIEAHDLINKHLGLHQLRVLVEPMSYLPGSHAVLRHDVFWRRKGQITLYARVLPLHRVPRVMAADQVMHNSGFLTPWIAGSWDEGGLIWLSGIPGPTVRSLIKSGHAPDPGPILDAISRLWASSPPANTQPMDFASSLRWTQKLLGQMLQDDEGAALLGRTVEALAPAVETWRPTALAHNDFYDAQIVVAPNGRLAVVDYDEAGPGDPLLDIGNFLAHMRWMAHFSHKPDSPREFGERLRQAALERFGWNAGDLALREAFAVFRLATNGIRSLGANWQGTVKEALGLALEALSEVKLKT